MPDSEPGVHSERTYQPATIPLLEHRLSRVEQRLDEFEPIKDDLYSIRRDLHVVRDRQGWLLWGVAAVIIAVLSGVGTITTRMILTALDTTAATVQEERLAAIAERIEAGDLPMTRDGPRLYELQQALPGIRGISRAERAAACLRAETRVPGVCSTPSP
mgnify:CR=1 FL=1